jgi:Fuc2NAc and GlcNAc transferase
MNITYLTLTVMITSGISYLTTAQLIKIATKHALLDIANHRSAHTKPTPRIGGLGFVMLMSIILIAHYFLHSNRFSSALYLTLLLPPLLVAIISFIEDITGSTPRLTRLAGHFLAVSLSLYLLKIPPENTLAIAIALVSALAMVWTINLYNFMDGIDGLATTEALFILIASASFAFIQHQPEWAFLQLLLLGPLLGFLYFNWQPAKIFMGDVGSTYLGALLAILLAIGIANHTLTLCSAILLLGTFLTDATWTLTYRFITHQKWYQPHRSHAYQILQRSLNSHAKTNLYNMGINVAWLWPLSYLALKFPLQGHWFTLLGLLPLFIICHFFKAGHADVN